MLVGAEEDGRILMLARVRQKCDRTLDSAHQKVAKDRQFDFPASKMPAGSAGTGHLSVTSACDGAVIFGL